MSVQIENWSTFIITTLGAFGGWAVVVAALTHYLSDIFAKRALQREASRFSEQLAGLSHELKLRESSYSKHLDLLLEYYSIFYRHYRLCQNATNQDAHRMPDGTVIKTKEVFFEQLDSYLSESKAQEGKARLVLPTALLQLNEAAIEAFNEFKDAMKRDRYDEEFQEQKRKAFGRVHSVKEQLESGLREFLRTEHLLKAPR
jgi:signal transduction histidine kinase